MILGKLWKSLAAQMNKIANFFWTADPIAQLQYEYDKAVDQMKEGREGLEQYRALVERVTRQVNGDQQHVAALEARIKAYLQVGERETASKFALELQKAKKELAENGAQLKLHETAYTNNVTKIQHATKKLADLKQKIQKYDAELKLSRAESELAKLATSFNFDITTDFGQIEDVIQDKIGLNRAKVRVARPAAGHGPPLGVAALHLRGAGRHGGQQAERVSLAHCGLAVLAPAERRLPQAVGGGVVPAGALHVWGRGGGGGVREAAGDPRGARV
jgi:phage shock protein A